MSLSSHVQNIIKQRYLRAGEKTWADVAVRVALKASLAEKDASYWEDQFFNIINERIFIPGGRITSEIGYSNQLTNCNVSPIKDHLEDIFNETLYKQMRLYSRSGSSGYSFSDLTPRSTKTTRGYAAGPVAFMGLVSKVAQVIYQESSRNPGSMGVLRGDHPDVFEFISAKALPNKLNTTIIESFVQWCTKNKVNVPEALFKKLQQILVEKTQFANFNISVGLFDYMMEANLASLFTVHHANVHGNKPFVYKENFTYHDFFQILSTAMHAYGEPGILFLDTINKHHPLMQEIHATNVCGEQALLPNENCFLGHLNLYKIWLDAKQKHQGKPVEIQLQAFSKDLRKYIPTAIRFLDNVIDVTEYAHNDFEKAQKYSRKVGLGILGWADFLLDLQIPYNSGLTHSLINNIGADLRSDSYLASIKLAEEKGYNQKMWKEITEKNKLRGLKNAEMFDTPRRNTCLNTIAPTGTGAQIAETSYAIEPIHSWKYVRYDEVSPDGYVSDWHHAVKQYCEDNKITDIEDFVNSKQLPDYFQTAHDLSPKDHIDVVARWQKYIDSSISKTINCPNDITVAEVQNLIFYAHAQGCKAFTIYRKDSREFEVIKDNSTKNNVSSGRIISYKRASKTYSIPTGHSKLHVTITEDNNNVPYEVFCTIGKTGSDTSGAAEAVGRMVSAWLQQSEDLEHSLTVLDNVSKQLRGIGGEKPRYHEQRLVKSIWDGLSIVIAEYLKDKKEPKKQIIQEKPKLKSGNANTITCPSCNASFESFEKCPICPVCGYSNCEN